MLCWCLLLAKIILECKGKNAENGSAKILSKHKFSLPIDEFYSTINPDFCRNPGYPTIEEELLKAFKEAGTICDEWFETPQKGHFQRASRTDKGVSAARMVISLKFRKYIKCRTVE